MRILQTYWSQKKTANTLFSDGGFLSPEIHWMSWALSCLSLKRFYPEVELYTDKAGKEILIDLLKLPYSKVHNILDDSPLTAFKEFLWAFPKVYVYSLQKSPFLHVDGDVAIWRAFDESKINKPLFVQHIDENISYYKTSIQKIKKHATYIPQWVYENENYPMACNTGVIGGSDISFFQEYTRLAFDYINKNHNTLEKMYEVDKDINVMPEQCLCYHVAKKSGIAIENYYGKNITNNNEVNSFVSVYKIPFECFYFHPMGRFKKRFIYNDFINYTLKQEFPEYWHHIVKLFKKEKNMSSYFKRYLEISNGNQIIPQDEAINKKVSFLTSAKGAKTRNINLGTEDIGTISPVLENLYNTEKNYYEKGTQHYTNNSFKVESFPLYKINKKHIYLSNFSSYFIAINPYHNIIRTKYNFSYFFSYETFEKAFDFASPTTSFAIVYLHPFSYSVYNVSLNDFALELFESLKKETVTIGELLKKYSDQEKKLNSKKNSLITTIERYLLAWYQSGVITFVKKRKPQKIKASAIYEQRKTNLNAQLSNVFGKVISYLGKHYNHDELDDVYKYLDGSLKGFITAFQKLGIKTRAVRVNSKTLDNIPLPAISKATLRSRIKIYIVIKSVSEDRITIFNPEFLEEEIYGVVDFLKIWDPVIVIL